MIELLVGHLLPLALLGALLGLDVVAFPQAMLSRPIVAATLVGGFLGAPDRGLLVGVALEFFALEAMPFGATRYPEWGSASVVGSALFTPATDGTTGAMLLAVLFALITAGLGGASMHLLRQVNAALAKRQQVRIARGSGGAVVALQLAGLTADLLRGGVLTFGVLLVLGPAYRRALEAMTISASFSRAMVVGTASAVGLAALWKLGRTTPGAPWYLAVGLVAGFALAGGLL
ncbi:MAG: PTS sugar transporter subunit IIC [Gemmatimonadota bacterium]|nr:PTS sugar transporter subunit IIC [Gemmatimonadota bacterium]MDQ8147144.1 PTS sugar transporter subunit IIC [Gemmatimonadota bacterium]MDQ8149023.1 PTS sugar transporter subunit IIC [Gemmatimonadota bacterium]MDQ8156476.1 PTS sugar transporter subunit IIC [Gemmatimonadota bacterium]MDQ8176473.1 PTS sugar transporter subunit IIC [Gemmatimonadota bacterium]